MGEDDSYAWTWWLEEVYLVHSPDEAEEWIKPKYLTRTDKDVPLRTTDEEFDLIKEQIESSEGFDIDFTMFRCVFNYHPVDLNDNEFAEPETNADLLTRLSKRSLADYNQENMTEYEFVKLLYANFHLSSGAMFLITFEAKDPVHNSVKKFQARVRYCLVNEAKSNFVFCRLKPEQEVSTDEEDSIGVAEKDAKKPRLE